MSETETKATHTPGPWEIDADLILGAAGSGTDYHRDDDVHAVICAQESGDSERWRVNARLIAAAPDLLEACRAAESALIRYGPIVKDDKRGLMWNQSLRSIRAAIAKAEGKG